MNPSDAGAAPEWRFVRFGLIVTGHAEAQCLPRLFRIVEE